MFPLPSFPFSFLGILSLSEPDTGGVGFCIIFATIFALLIPVLAGMLWSSGLKRLACSTAVTLLILCSLVPYSALSCRTTTGMNYLKTHISNDGVIPAYVFHDMGESVYGFDYEWVRDSNGKPTFSFINLAQKCGAKIVSTRSTLSHTYLFMEVCPNSDEYGDTHAIYKVDAVSFLISLNEATHADAKKNSELKKETQSQNDFEESRPYQGPLD